MNLIRIVVRYGILKIIHTFFVNACGKAWFRRKVLKGGYAFS